MENFGNDRISVLRVTATDHSIYLINVYMPSSNAAQSEYKICLDGLDDIIFQLSHLSEVLIAGDFNAHIGSIGGPRSFNTVNRRGLELGYLIEKHRLISVNSQQFAKGPIETYSANKGTCLTTVDHIMIIEDHADLVISCEVRTEQCLNLSYHHPIVCVLQISATHCIKNVAPRSHTAWNKIKNVNIHRRYKESVKRHLRNLVDNQDEITSIDEIE